MVSCEKEEFDNKNGTKLSESYTTSSISQNRIALAESLIEVFKTDEKQNQFVISRCYEMFDGDRNVLLSSLCSNDNEQLKSSSKTFKNSLSDCLSKRTSSLKSTNGADVLETILNTDNLVQLYLFTSNGTQDSMKFDGIVVLPEDYNDQVTQELIVYKKDGTQSTVMSNVDPKENYLVISSNERGGLNNLNTESNNQSLHLNNSNLKAATEGKNMTIVRAKFVSLSAKRTVESWARGEPEVRMSVIYAEKNESNAWIGRTSTFYWSKDWIKNDFWTNWVVWNNNSINCPYWNKNTQGTLRELRWVEEDESTKETTSTIVYKDPVTGITSTTTVKIPAASGDDFIASSYIDYDNTPAGEQNWGLIKFDIAY